MKKVIITCLFLLLVMLPCYSTVVSVEDLVVAANIPTSGVNIYYGTTTEQITPVGSVNPTLAQILQSSTEKLVVFVDEEPEKGWEHNCSYYYAATTDINGQVPYYKVSAKVPRSDYDLTDYDVSVSGNDIIANVPQTCLDASQLNAGSHTYAIILSGGINKFSNHSRYWNDCSFIYQTLVKRYGVPRSHISSLVADGTNPADDMIITGGAFSSSPLDFDDDGINDIQYAATRQNLINVLQDLSSVLTPQDQLFLFVIDHGGFDVSTGSSYICLWNSQRIYDYELATLLDDFNVNSMSIVLGQCHSGGFIDDLAASNRVIATACTASQLSYACSNLEYDEFVYHWTSAINEATPYRSYVFSDANNNGFVTMREAFDYAEANDDVYETPQFSSISTALGDTLAFNNEAFVYKLIVRDNDADDGTEPNITTTDAWSSPDLWTRNQPDGITNQYHESININSEYLYTYVRVKNVGQKIYNDNSMYIHLYWAPASLGLTDDAWNGNTDVGGSLQPRKLRTVIQPDGSYIYEYGWEIPDAIIDSVEISGEPFHICHLVALSTSSRQMMPLPLIGNTHVVDVLGNNWIAQRNISFYANGNNAATELPLYVRNVYDDAREYSIEIVPVENEEDNFSNIETTIRLSDPLFSAWEKGGSQSTKAVAYKSLPEKFYLRGTEGKIENIKLERGQREKIYCMSNIIANKNITEEKIYRYNIVQRDKHTGDVVGGERIEILVKPRQAIIPVINRKVENGQVRLMASNINEAVRYEWYDENGNKIGEEEEILLTPDRKNREYKLKVCAESDGVVSYAVIMVDSQLGIESISPVPFKEEINIKLSCPADNNTFICITPVNTVGQTERHQVKPGESEASVYVFNHSKGNYIVSLVKDDTVLDSKQIIHE